MSSAQTPRPSCGGPNVRCWSFAEATSARPAGHEVVRHLAGREVARPVEHDHRLHLPIGGGREQQAEQGDRMLPLQQAACGEEGQHQQRRAADHGERRPERHRLAGDEERLGIGPRDGRRQSADEGVVAGIVAVQFGQRAPGEVAEGDAAAIAEPQLCPEAFRAEIARRIAEADLLDGG